MSLCLLSPPMGRLKRNIEILVSSRKKKISHLSHTNLGFISKISPLLVQPPSSFAWTNAVASILV